MSIPSHPQLNWRAAGTTSDPIELPGITLCGFYFPSGWTGTSVSFLVSPSINNPNFVPLQDETGSPITYTVAASTYCRAQPADFAGIKFIKMVAGSSQAAATQVKLAAREIA